MKLKDAKANHRNIDRRLGQLGIDVRQSGQHERMRAYIRLLRHEIRMTEGFLLEERERSPIPDYHLDVCMR